MSGRCSPDLHGTHEPLQTCLLRRWQSTWKGDAPVHQSLTELWEQERREEEERRRKKEEERKTREEEDCTKRGEAEWRQAEEEEKKRKKLEEERGRDSERSKEDSERSKGDRMRSKGNTSGWLLLVPAHNELLPTENLRSYPWFATQPVPTWLRNPCLGCPAMQASGRGTPPPLPVFFIVESSSPSLSPSFPFPIILLLKNSCFFFGIFQF
jgi:hypothetical protein